MSLRIPAGKRMFGAKGKLEKERQHVLDNIHYERWQFELMSQRAQATGEPANADFFNAGIGRFAALEKQAVDAKTIDEFDDLIEKAEEEGTLRAYMCPMKEVPNEGNLAIDIMAEWSIPKSTVEALRNSLGQKVLNNDPFVARGALKAIFSENNSWAKYTDDYEDEMQRYTYWLVAATCLLLILAGVGFHFRQRFFPFVFFAIFLCAGAAGSCVSVIRKMPLFDISLSAELDAYGRRIWSRVVTGTVASLVGCALLAWGVLPISIQEQTYSGVVAACAAQDPSGCTMTKILILLAVAILFGFSERTLTSFEQRMLGAAEKDGN